ncbi:helix-turn-helix domain-containing protein [Microlunatus parietis]|uniref:Transcriptional regulator with XRE-family HTH domain n=1 Tax=Microlunatus parietis TaxID=682979 RepID=A0A7Y9IAE6_9ACTN|nr:helix-turn-helix transcriptional regulator [Microlunatus parietis]NYE73182.1 transcriptional regulator with XRE-family HTH domain [Microlunatus parietis]
MTTADQLGDRTAVGGDLGTFLRTRRAALRPDQVCLPTYGQRRVPGLRREELAELAGVSSTYYTRLEQGLATNASDQVLDAVARALRLSTVERAHLFELARGPRPELRDPDAEGPARNGLVRVLDALADAPTILLGRSHDILAWNRLGHALLAPHLPFAAPNDLPRRPNKIALLFLDAPSRSLYREWEFEAELAVASLHYVAAQYPGDPALTRLIGELTVASRDFARIWAEHPVELCISGVKRYHHPELGRVDLDYEVLHVPGDEGQRYLIHTARPGSPDEAALRLLASRSITG